MAAVTDFLEVCCGHALAHLSSVAGVHGRFGRHIGRSVVVLEYFSGGQNTLAHPQKIAPLNRTPGGCPAASCDRLSLVRPHHLESRCSRTRTRDCALTASWRTRVPSFPATRQELIAGGLVLLTERRR